MATKKKTTVEELKELIDRTPKNTLTKEQIDQLRDIASDLLNIRRTLQDLEGQDDVSKIMFNVGAMYIVADQAENSMDSFLEDYNEEDESWGNDF